MGFKRVNLAFGDFVNGEERDDVVSNNMDYVKVLSTVVKSVYLFFEQYPNMTIEIEAIDKERLRLYNLIFQRRYQEIRDWFIVHGWIGNERELYHPEKFYWRFEICLRNEYF
jgi:hypothetical protein